MLLAAAAGAVARYLVDIAVQRRADGGYPWGTFWVNVSGCLVLGLVIGWSDHHSAAALRAIAGIGFCGAYTTFSTFSVESVRLIETGRYGAAARYAGSSVLVGCIAAAAGLALAG